MDEVRDNRDGEQRMRDGEVLCIFFGGPLDHSGIWQRDPLHRMEALDTTMYGYPRFAMRRSYTAHRWVLGEPVPGERFAITVLVYMVDNPTGNDPKEATLAQVFGRAVEYGAIPLRRLRYLGMPIQEG